MRIAACATLLAFSPLAFAQNARDVPAKALPVPSTASPEMQKQIAAPLTPTQYYRDVNAPETKEAFSEIAAFFDKHLGK
jgi:hypothetical protein